MQAQTNSVEMVSYQHNGDMSNQMHSDTFSGHSSPPDSQGEKRITNTHNPLAYGTADSLAEKLVSLIPTAEGDQFSQQHTHQTSMSERHANMTSNTVNAPEVNEPPISEKPHASNMQQQNMPATAASEDHSFPSGTFEITVIKKGKERQTGIINFAYRIETLVGQSYAGRFTFDIRFPYQLSSTPVPSQLGYQMVLLTQHYAAKRFESEADFNAKIHKEHDPDSLESLDVERTVFSRTMDKGTAKAVYKALSKAIHLAVQGQLQVQQEEGPVKLANVVSPPQAQESPVQQQRPTANTNIENSNKQLNKILIAGCVAGIIGFAGIAYILNQGGFSSVATPAQQPTPIITTPQPYEPQSQNDIQNNQLQEPSLNDQPLLWSPQ